MPITDATALTDAGHQLAAVHGWTGGADSGSGRWGALTRTASRGEAGACCCERQNRGHQCGRGHKFHTCHGCLCVWFRQQANSLLPSQFPAAFRRSLRADPDFASKTRVCFKFAAHRDPFTRVCPRKRAPSSARHQHAQQKRHQQRRQRRLAYHAADNVRPARLGDQLWRPDFSRRRDAPL